MAKNKTYSVILDEKEMEYVRKIMDTYGFSQSAAIRFLLKKGIEYFDKQLSEPLIF